MWCGRYNLPMSDRVIVEAPGKVNLFLQVGPLRNDGYHQVRTVMQAVNLRDELQLELRKGADDYRVSPGDLTAILPWTTENLARKAWESFRDELGKELRNMGLVLRLHKRIPIAGGMGGGSADAAAVLTGLNRLCGEPLRKEQLQRMAAGLGSDVPFFLEGGTALAEGRGERITPLKPAPPLHLVVILSQEHLSTADVYACFDRRKKEGGRDGERGWNGGLELFLDTLRGKDPAAILTLMHNDLQECCLELSRDAASRFSAFRRLAGSAGLKGRSSPVMVSGSGPTLFLAVEDEGEARKLLQLLIEEMGKALLLSFEKGGCLIREQP